MHRVSRAVHFPQSFPNRTFSVEGLLQFLASDRDAKDADHYGLSVVCRCIMPEDAAVHAYGEVIADKQNKAFSEREGYPPPEDKKRTYLAFYNLEYHRLSEVVLEYYTIAVRAVPEDGEWAHLEIHFVRNDVVSDSPKRRRADRGAAISSIADRLTGPVRSPINENDNLIDRQNELPEMLTS